MVQAPERGPSSNQPQETSGTNKPRLRIMPLSNLQIILIALIVVGGRLVIDFSQRIIEGQQKVTEQQRLEAEISALLHEKRALEVAKAYYGSSAFIEAWAHDQGKMVREGEILVIPIYEGAAQVSDTITAPSSRDDAHLSPWQVWWTLFFGSPPPQRAGTLGE